MQLVSLQLFVADHWHDVADIYFSDSVDHAPVTLAYKNTYMQLVPEFGKVDQWACSINAPVSLVPKQYSDWPAWLETMLPAGNAKQWWLNQLELNNQTLLQQNIGLLRHTAVAPIGNLRIKQAHLSKPISHSNTFSINQVVAMQYDFLDYINRQCANIGGNTGAGGSAPQLLLMLEGEIVHIDSDFAGKQLSAMPYLVKYARNNKTPLDNAILKAEGIYYKVLSQILARTDIAHIDATRLRIEEYQGQISLWLPRFDVQVINDVASPVAIENIYSIIEAANGSKLDHFQVIKQLWRRLAPVSQMSKAEFVKEYVARDLLNSVFGNSDNHGGNMAFIKLDGDVCFAPIYNFAPIKADPQMRERLFYWGRDCEQSEHIHFSKIAQYLADYCPPQEMLAFLRKLAIKLISVPQMLKDEGCPIEILDSPAIGFQDLQQKLQEMVMHDD